MKLKKNINNKKFFDTVSEYYNDMIGFDSSLLRRTGVYKKILNPAIKTAADRGCGTGLDSIALAKNGISVTAFDLSPEMIKAAKKNAVKHNCKINFFCSGIDIIPKKYYGKFDSAVSMGNTLANLNRITLSNTFKKIYKILNNNGVVIFQVLNFEKIIKENKRILKISSIAGEFILRFYDIHNKYMNFNILKFNKANPNSYELITTKLYPHSKKEILDKLKVAGFRKIKVYGNLNFDKFSVNKSNDLVVYAKK